MTQDPDDPDVAERFPIRTLLAMACDGVGPSAACVNLMTGAHLAGYTTDIFATRRRIPAPPVPIRTPVPGPIAYLPYRWVSAQAHRAIEARFLDAVRPGDITYLWPNASLETHRILHARGFPIVLEGINTRMASAKRILDAAYEAFDTKPAHSITAARIAEEEEKYKYARAIFAPGRSVEAALKGSPLENRAIPASYGVDTTRARPGRTYADHGRPLTFLFCGYACVRKGAHFLLDAWARMPGPHKLQFVGRIEPLIAERYSRILASDRVELVGFVKDVHPYFAGADVFVFPSLEEGDPLVTYEAALHGLPIIASPMGASRLGETEGTMLIVDPARADDLAAALDRLAGDADQRAALGQAAQAAVQNFDWRLVGAARARALMHALAGATV